VTRALARFAAGVLAAVFLAAPGSVHATHESTSPRSSLDRLTDAEFWSLVTTLSEPGGAFHSDNFTSNEALFGNIAETLAAGPHGGAFIGVGPEQNFSYISAIEPQIAFIVDIRRQAVMQHLLFKAIFELASDRAEFISLLFAMPRPAGLTSAPTIDAIWAAFPAAPGADDARYRKNLTTVEDQLARTHGFSMSDDDRASLEYVYEAFFKLGPAINYAGYAAGLTTGDVNFAKLAVAADGSGTKRSFLATERSFTLVKDLETRNLVVPIQGDFAGPHAIRGVGDFLRTHSLTVRAFYISNVEQYLFHPEMPAAPGGREQNGGWRAFYENVATLPMDESSTFVRAAMGASTVSVRETLPDGTTRYVRRESARLCPMIEFLNAFQHGRVLSMQDATSCQK
jgi:hypothetical protein